VIRRWASLFHGLDEPPWDRCSDARVQRFVLNLGAANPVPGRRIRRPVYSDCQRPAAVSRLSRRELFAMDASRVRLEIMASPGSPDPRRLYRPAAISATRSCEPARVSRQCFLYTAIVLRCLPAHRSVAPL